MSSAGKNRLGNRFDFMKYIIFLFLIVVSSTCEAAKEKTSHKICLNMIVKNEAPVIERCLASVKNLIDYWVIVDTGSVDGTQEIIKKCLKNIPGELHERPWVNFAHNRNEALKFAKNKGEYLLFIDADERLVFVSDFDKTKLNMDCYLSFVRVFDQETREKYLHGQRILLVNNHLNWTWEGVLHENLVCSEAKRTQLLKNIINIADTYEGHRSQDPLKGLKDAEVLEKIHQEDPNNRRIIFFLAQSYEYAKKYELALQNYEKRAAMDGNEQEVFWSLFRIGQNQEEMQWAPETIIESYCKAFKNRASRLEPLYYMALQYGKIGNSVLSYAILKSGLSFGPCEDVVVHEAWIYDYGLLLEFAKSAFTIGRYEESCDAWKKLLAKPDLPLRVQTEAKNGLSMAQQALVSSHSLAGSKPEFVTTNAKESAKKTIEEYCADFKACPTRAAPLFYLAEHYAKNLNQILAYAIAKAGVSIPPPGQIPNQELWIYEYGLLDQWGNAAFALQKFSEAIEAFEILLSEQNIPDEIRMNARRKIFKATQIILNLEKHGLPCF